jgi:mevalonate kinase
MGEHAVVYGRPALAAAIDLRLTVRIASRPKGPAVIRLDLPCVPHAEETSWSAVLAYSRAARESWREYSREPGPDRFRAVRGEDPAHIVKAALGEAAEALGETEPPGIDLRVESRLPIGSGFGSSAATAVGVVAAYLTFRGEDLDSERIERLALEAERRQHGLPSGIDTATVLRGGLLWARRLPSGELETERSAVRSPLLSRLRVYDTGTPPEPTGAVVAAVRALRDRDPARHERLLDGIEAAVRAFQDELARPEEDPARIVQMIRDCEGCLEGMGVVPGPVRVLVRRIEAEGGAAKISGAGSLAGPGAGSLLIYHPRVEEISGWPFLQPFPFHPVFLGAEGLRLEETDA